jgi:hypothetical protein
MTETGEEAFDVPEPERTLAAPEADISALDPGADVPLLSPDEPGLGEDPAYDPGGMGRQPDADEDDEDHR